MPFESGPAVSLVASSESRPADTVDQGDLVFVDVSPEAASDLGVAPGLTLARRVALTQGDKPVFEVVAPTPVPTFLALADGYTVRPAVPVGSL